MHLSLKHLLTDFFVIFLLNFLFLSKLPIILEMVDETEDHMIVNLLKTAS